MKTMTNLIAMMIVLAVLGLLLAGGYYAYVYLEAQFVMLEFPFRVALLTVVSVVMLSTLMLLIGLRSTAVTMAKGRLNDRKQALYAHILMIFRTLLDNKIDRQNRVQLLEELGQIYADLLILSSGAALKAHMTLLGAIKANDGDQEHLEACFRQLLKHLRRDMGHADGYELINLREIFRFLPSDYVPMQQAQLEK